MFKSINEMAVSGASATPATVFVAVSSFFGVDIKEEGLVEDSERRKESMSKKHDAHACGQAILPEAQQGPQ